MKGSRIKTYEYVATMGYYKCLAKKIEISLNFAD